MLKGWMFNFSFSFGHLECLLFIWMLRFDTEVYDRPQNSHVTSPCFRLTWIFRVASEPNLLPQNSQGTWQKLSLMWHREKWMKILLLFLYTYPQFGTLQNILKIQKFRCNIIIMTISNISMCYSQSVFTLIWQVWLISVLSLVGLKYNILQTTISMTSI